MHSLRTQPSAPGSTRSAIPVRTPNRRAGLPAHGPAGQASSQTLAGEAQGERS
jgi:hypothetical protein